ncbi:tetratricopeptide repeat protein [Nostoc sp.]|uniref:tetratricopeptide repeat protein n=1 Tax=Nostoc sp. TaxID=1180 RepID=UPI002FF7A81C
MAKGFGAEKPKKGNIKRQNAYLQLIFALLKCPHRWKPKMLMANRKLIDSGLVKAMGIVAIRLAEEGDHQSTNFLIELANWLAEELGLSSDSETFSRFLLQMKLAMDKRNGHLDAVHPILKTYLEQDNLFIQRFRIWATSKFNDVVSQDAQFLAVFLATFGSIIAEFPLGDRAENLEEAIACHLTALEVLSLETSAKQWGDAQDRLATAFCNRIKGDQAENLEFAIDTYKKALQVFTSEELPREWGKTKNNLGNAYRDRIWGDKIQNLELAIAAHQNALEVRSREACPELWAMTQMNLAIDYRHRLEGDKAENLEIAIAANQAALQVYTPSAFPEDWADIQNNLGNVYRDQIFAKKSENLNLALSAFQAALQVYTRHEFPEKWALTQINLGNVYLDLKQAVQGIECYRTALEIFTPTDFPQHCFKASRNMGYAVFNLNCGGKRLKVLLLQLKLWNLVAVGLILNFAVKKLWKKPLKFTKRWCKPASRLDK